jgi:hypothetical protein
MPPRPIAFFATSRSGLGHLRRCATIARALRRMAPDRPLTLVTNAPPTGLEPLDIAAFHTIHLADRTQMADHLPPGATAVLDTMNLPDLEPRAAARALILRETPDAQLPRFTPQEKPFDITLIANPAAHWLPPLPPRTTRRITPVGWIYRPTGTIPLAPRSTPRLLIATGGGGTAETAAQLHETIGEILALTRAACAIPFRAEQAIGPRAAGFGTVPGIDATLDPGGSLNLLFRDADASISTAGYNSVLELATTDTPTLLLPIPRSIDDQEARVRLWSPRLGPPSGSPSDAALWLARTLATRTRRAPVDLGPSGEDAAAAAILSLG